MGDHIAYYRTAPGDEEIAFVKLARRLADKCENFTWRASRSFLYRGRRQKGVKSAKRRSGSSHERPPLSDILNVDIDSLEARDLAQRLKSFGATAVNAFHFDARVAPGHEVGGYLLLMLETNPMRLNDSWGNFRLWMDFRLVATPVEDEEFDPNSLESRAHSLAFVCGASVDKRPISEIQDCIISPEGIHAEEGRVFSRYFDSLRDLVAQLRVFQADSASAGISSGQRERDLRILDLMSDRELLKWYLDIANGLPGYRARKAGNGFLTSTTDSSGMTSLYATLLKSLE